jgi:SAM-dependent methyltransferase
LRPAVILEKMAIRQGIFIMAAHANQKTLRGRLSAWLLNAADETMDRIYGARKRSVFQSLQGRVVEIGPGPGANLRYYSKGMEVIAVEPNPAMHPFLMKNARRHGVDIDIRGLKGEAMDIETESADVAIGTLVLCTVDDPERVVSEVYRILKPGGRYIFFEHVAAPLGSKLRGWQNWLQRPWTWVSEGCHLNRNTHSTIFQAGFASVDMDCFHLDSSLTLVAPHIFGVATK